MKKLLLLFCAVSIVTLCTTGCNSSSTDTPTTTQPPTQIPTQAPTSTTPPTQAPTPPPTHPPTQPPTQVEEIPQEDGTFYTIIEEPITTPPPTEIPTVAPTQAPTEDESLPSSENDTVAGSWTLAYYERNGRHISPKTTIVYTFNIDGTFSINNNGFERTGRYSFNGEILSYVSDINGEIGNFVFDETKDILTDTDGDNIAVFMRNE
ncbi:MAG: hypothetical protein IJU14_01995 [Clostridia bacterium]|nr:hypothetical protein [Clostridia bacterium]